MKNIRSFTTSLLFICLLLTSSCFATPNLQLPKIYNNQDLTGWACSEKYDGIRGYWDGKALYSKNGYKFDAPEYFIKNLPPFPLDGEIWGGRGTFESTSSIVKTHGVDKGWHTLKFMIFDTPADGLTFEQRMAKVRKYIKSQGSDYGFRVKSWTAKNSAHVQEELNRIVAGGGEGIIAIHPDSEYTFGRTANILKLKTFDDMEVVVLSHIEGKGRNKGRMGSLLVKLLDKNTQFKIGTGFSDKDRANPPPIGSIITIKYTGFTKTGKPKFASFIRIRSIDGKLIL